MEVQQLEIDMKKLKDSHERNLADAVKETQDKMSGMMDQMQAALTEAMSAKGDLLCLNEKASDLIAKEIKQMPKEVLGPEQTLLKIESALVWNCYIFNYYDLISQLIK